MKELSEYQQEQNYRTLKESIAILKNGGRITEDWMYDQMKFIEDLRDMFPDFTRVHMDNTDTEFRARARDAEVLAEILIDEINFMKSFTLKTYYEFLLNIEHLTDSAMEEHELCELFAKF